MKKLLVPCDFSKPAINAFKIALAIAKRSKAAIHLLFVIELPVMPDPFLLPVPDYESTMRLDLQRKATKKFSQLIKKYVSGDVPISTSVQFGLTTQTILETIEDEHFDLVVMGSHGAGGWREFFIGSCTERIVRFSNVPVLVVKNPGTASVENIVFPCSTEIESSNDFVARVKNIQEFFGARLHMVWINTPANFVSDVITRQRLSDFASKNQLQNFTIHIFNDLDEMEGILQFAKSVSGDLIVMATHGRRGLAHLFRGSLTEDVVNHAPNLLWTYVVKEKPGSAVRKIVPTEATATE